MNLIAKMITDEPGRYRVWSEDDDPKKPANTRYTGPVAEVFSEKDEWIYVRTCPHEGNVMLNASTLPALIDALQHLMDHLDQNAALSKARGQP